METFNTLPALPVTMTSREIAELTSKRHDHVLRDIRNMIAELEAAKLATPELGWHCESETYIDAQGKPRDQYRLDFNTTMTLLTGYRADLRMKVIVRWQELEAAAASTPRPNAYTLPYQPALEIQVLDSVIRELRVSETSKIRMYAAFCKSNNINSDFLPEYVNEPLVRAITPLLKEMGSDLSSKVARTVNPALEAMGILVHLSRNSKSKGIKKFWSLTEEGLKYGRNETSPSDPRETQPLFFVDRFPELLARLEAYLDEQKRRLI
jgi:phage regulator Rha-like protein